MDAQARIANAVAALDALEASDFPTVLGAASQIAFCHDGDSFSASDYAACRVWSAIGRALAKASDAVALDCTR